LRNEQGFQMPGSRNTNERSSEMPYLRASAVAVSVLALAVTGPAVKASENEKTPASITVAFGTGLNNAQAGNTPNHHILPQEFKVRITRAKKLDGTVVVVPASVMFVVAGFHWPWVYQPGVKLQEVVDHIPPASVPPAPPVTFVNYEVIVGGVSNVFAKGVNPGTPAGGFLDGAQFPLSPTQNRTDTIAFSTPGKYLVICNVRGHFIDGMYAWIRVVDDDDDDDRDHDHGHDK
jgi:hypothetical protein